MSKTNEVIEQNAIMEYSSKILEIIQHADDFTTSDLQGVIEALVSKIIKHNQL